MPRWYNNDKVVVVLAVVIITLASLFKLGEVAKDIPIAALSGLFGLVTGIGIGVGLRPKERRPDDEGVDS